ncbi:MAG TPA: cell division protein ZapA [Syntrophales bacterium]|nr:cell division protein ZapA [Syntrophales bacterium]
MKRSFHIEILGQKLTVLSDSDEKVVAGIVQYVNDKVEEISKGGNNLNTLTIAVLAALNIADELFKAKGENSLIGKQLESRTQELIDLIDRVNCS